MSNRTNGDQPKQPSRLPGRFYTLIITGLATILVAIPFLRPQMQAWSTVAIVQHLPIENNDAKSIVIGNLQSAIDQVEVNTIPEVTLPSAEELQTLVRTSTTEAPDSEERLTTIQVHHQNRQLSADFAGILARELSNAATIRDNTASVVSLESSHQSHIGRESLLKIGAFAVCFGVITILFPRPRKTAKSDSNLEQVEQAIGLPILGSVFPSRKSNGRKESRNIPLRSTVLIAELVVAAAFLLMVYAAATHSSFAANLLGNPLDTYAETVRNVWTGF